MIINEVDCVNRKFYNNQQQIGRYLLSPGRFIIYAKLELLSGTLGLDHHIRELFVLSGQLSHFLLLTLCKSLQFVQGGVLLEYVCPQGLDLLFQLIDPALQSSLLTLSGLSDILHFFPQLSIQLESLCVLL